MCEGEASLGSMGALNACAGIAVVAPDRWAWDIEGVKGEGALRPVSGERSIFSAPPVRT